MNGKVVLLTGVPGVGKSFLAKALESNIQPLKVLAFGELILRFQQRVAPKTEYQDLRKNPTEKATLNSIEEATNLLLKELQRLRKVTNVLIDSHAVAKDDYGFRATPDSLSVLRRFRLTGIIVLHDDPSKIVSRITQDQQGRHLVTREEVAAHIALQDSVSMAYGVAVGCPVFVLDRRKTFQDDIALLLRIFDALGVQYSKHEVDDR